MIDPSTPIGEALLERLRADEVGWLTTVTAAGQPQSAPVWFVWDRDEVLLYSYRTAARNRNLRANPRVSFHLADHDGSDIVSLEGEARFDPDAPRATEHPPYLAKYERLIAATWSHEAFDTDYPHAVRIRVTRVTTA